MKILFDHNMPFRLAHGGFQIHIEQTRNALKKNGVDVDWIRWWDDTQPGDLIHYFGRPSPGYARLARERNIKLAFNALHSSLGARPGWKRSIHAALIRGFQRLAPGLVAQFAWDSYQLADACLVVTPWEGHLAQTVFGAPAERVHVVPNGVEDVFLKKHASKRGDWLVTTASILPVKRIVETARAAVEAETPYWVVGKPFNEDDAYYREFDSLCRQHGDLLRYEGPVQDRQAMAAIYRQARGFVLLSHWESLSLSALEAAACGCPLLLSDLPWARSVFGKNASYCSPKADTFEAAQQLSAFYNHAPATVQTMRPLSWKEVAATLKGIYEEMMNQ